MALRDQPYMPLYVQDYLTDEKLNKCCPATQGIYIKIMCLFHKCDPYGGILLEQKDKQTEDICFNFARLLSRQLPFDSIEIKSALEELLHEKVLLMDNDFLYQKRMVRDNGLSILRSEIGKKGGTNTQKKLTDLAKAKNEANSENENENEIISVIPDNNLLVFDEFRKLFQGTKRGNQTEFDNFKKKHKDWKTVLPVLKESILNQIKIRETKIKNNQFVPEWKNLQTWINQRCWEEGMDLSGLNKFETKSVIGEIYVWKSHVNSPIEYRTSKEEYEAAKAKKTEHDAPICLLFKIAQ